MELRYPFMIIIALIFFISYVLITKKKIKAYKTGSKIANTKYIKNTDYYKNLIKKYKIISNIFKALCLTSIIFSILLLSRPAKIQTKTITEDNRDIILCMDVSASVDELNYELVDSLIDTVDNLNGERIGITIFNSSAVTLVPLTDDYDYLKDVLKTIKKAVSSDLSYKDDDYYYLLNYIMDGTSEGNNGSSLIGDGLASCVYSFPDKPEDRTKIIIFSTDNSLAGKPLVTLDKAADISKSKNVIVYGIGIKNMYGKDREEYQNAIYKTGGKYYEMSNTMVKDIVKDIDKTTKTKLNNKKETKEIDTPEIPFVIILLSIVSLIILNRKVV